MVHKKRIKGEQSGTFALEVLQRRFFLINYFWRFAVPKPTGAAVWTWCLARFLRTLACFFLFPWLLPNCALREPNYQQPPQVAKNPQRADSEQLAPPQVAGGRGWV